MSSLIDVIKSKASGVVASAQALADAEGEMGIVLPEQLRSIYLNVANGGVGPGYKILGVEGGHLSDEEIQ